MDDEPRHQTHAQAITPSCASPACRWSLLALVFALLCVFAAPGAALAAHERPLFTGNALWTAAILASDRPVLVAENPFAFAPEDALRRSALSSAVKRGPSPLSHCAPPPDFTSLRCGALPLSLRIGVDIHPPVVRRVVLPLPGHRGPVFFALPPPLFR